MLQSTGCSRTYLLVLLQLDSSAGELLWPWYLADSAMAGDVRGKSSASSGQNSYVVRQGLSEMLSSKNMNLALC